MKNPSAVIYDIEILRAIPNKPPFKKLEGIEYCEGWHDHANMGIGCLCAYDYLEDRYRVFTEKNLNEFIDLIQARELLVGFNSIAFDNNVVKACLGFDPGTLKNYDLLCEIWVASGLTSKFQYPSHAGFGLDETCRVNFGTQKSGDGAMAPVDWQRGGYGTVIDYCINDVKLTKQLFDSALAGLPIKSPKGGREITLALPFLKPEASA